jgi:transposase InsO family protein
VCWDNIQQESFWATLKVEFYNRYLWPAKAAAKVAVDDWIESVYNRRRRHSSQTVICPVEFEPTRRRPKPPDPVSTKRGQAHAAKYRGRVDSRA